MRLHHYPPTMLTLAILMAPLCAMAAGVDSPADEAQLKAAYIDRILNFVQWTGPKAGADTLVIGIVGDDALAAVLRTAATGRQGKPVVVRTAGSARELADACHAVWVAATIDGVARTAHPQWGGTAWTADRQVLTIGEDEGFTADGGVIGLSRETTDCASPSAAAPRSGRV